MPHTPVVLNFWKWTLSLMGVGLLASSWVTVVKPYEMKRLQRESARTAERLFLDFSTHSEEDLALIERLFLRIERDNYQAEAPMIDDLNLHFQKVHGLEAFVLPPKGAEGSLVLFNPYVDYAAEKAVKKRCDQALAEYPERLEEYQDMTIIPVGKTLCVYDPLLHMLAILNLSTTLSEHLEAEMLKGYFLALLESELPEIVSPNWDISQVSSSFFNFLGTEWKLHVYPSKAYMESSLKRMFLMFCLFSMGGLGSIAWWMLRRRDKSLEVDPTYVAHLKQLALYDGVTNLPNRRYCLDHLGPVIN